MEPAGIAGPRLLPYPRAGERSDIHLDGVLRFLVCRTGGRDATGDAVIPIPSRSLSGVDRSTIPGPSKTAAQRTLLA